MEQAEQQDTVSADVMDEAEAEVKDPAEVGEPKKEVNVTYETIFEILRREKSREELQKLEGTFFIDVVNYMREKQQALEDTEKKQDLFSSTERDKLKTQIDNIKKIIKELYERRERKILNIALSKSRTDSGIIDVSSMLAEEKVIYSNIVSWLNNARFGVLNNVLVGKFPLLEDVKEEKDAEKVDAKEGDKPASDDNFKMVRFNTAVPKFVGTDLEILGPFQEDDIARLPNEIADVLIQKGRAEEMG